MKKLFVSLLVLVGITVNLFSLSCSFVEKFESDEGCIKYYNVSVYDNETLLDAVDKVYSYSGHDYNTGWKWCVVDCWFDDSTNTTFYKICLCYFKD